MIRAPSRPRWRSEEHTSELQSHSDLVCRLLLEKKKKCDSLRHQGATKKQHQGSPRRCARLASAADTNLPLCVHVFHPLHFFFFLMIRRPPRSTLFPYRRSSDLGRLDLGPGYSTATIAAALQEAGFNIDARSEEHTSELQSHSDLVCRLLLEK